jgi:hypothetical protein
MNDHSTRQEVVTQLKTALAAQIQLSDATSEVASAIDRPLEDVLAWIQQVSITADAGAELLAADVNILLMKSTVQALDWTGLKCQDCENMATHAQVDVEDASTRSDVVINLCYCDECYRSNVSCFRWLHMETGR